MIGTINRLGASLFILFILWTCSSKTYAQHEEIDYGNIASVEDGTLFMDSSLFALGVDPGFYRDKIKLVYYFNGECSTCISAFLTFFSDWQKLNMAIPAFFIVSAPRLDIVDYYMEQASLKTQKSLQFILCDKERLNQKYNPFMDEVIANTYILLINEENLVIEDGNPLLGGRVFAVYKNMDSEFRNTYSLGAIKPTNGVRDEGILDLVDENDPPLILINGKEKSLVALRKLLDKISDYAYFEGSSAAVLYGEKAKNGVLVVTAEK